LVSSTPTDSDHGHRADFLPFSPPNLTEREIEAVVETLRSGWITTGPRTHQFEQAFGAFLGAESALALNSCTAGLHLALLALGVGPGDEVITTPMTFCSTVNVIEHVGARPVLADIDPETLTLDPAQAARAVTPRTKAILPVHYGGHPAEMEPLLALAREHSLHIVEDAAHALPATYNGRRIGTIGDLTAFSFYATKNLTTGEGGMLTGSPDLIESARVLSLHGMSRDAWNRYSAEGSWYYEVVAPGHKYNMTDIQAALGLVQLERLAEMQTRRREVAAQYSRAFSRWEYFQTPAERPHVRHAWHLYTLRLNLERLSIDRAQFIHELSARNIGASVHFIPIHLHPYYRGRYHWRPDDFPVAHREYTRLISLPLHPGLTNTDVQNVIDAVIEVTMKHRRP
jgi:dTDP-4-amino-4,6-dideoxygalactose transaminase